MDINSRLAIIGPRFFSYVEAIKSEFQNRGIHTISADDIHSYRLVWRIIYRARQKWLYMPFLKRYNRRLLQRLMSEKINHVLLVNCETYDQEFLNQCANNGIKISIYFWDSIRNKPIFNKFLSFPASVASFDPLDCDKYKLAYIPLFAENEFISAGEQRSSVSKYDFSIIATLHSNRFLWVLKLIELQKKSLASTKIFAFYSSKWLFFLRNLFRPQVLTLLGSISSTPMSKQEIARIFAESCNVLDVHHFKQNGLTSRTFETLASGSFLITTNTNVSSLPESLQNRIAVVSKPNDLARELRKREIDSLNAQEKYFLSIARFVDQLEELMDKVDGIQ